MRLLGFAMLLFVPWAGRAAEACPWLNAATAGGVLGGGATVSVVHESANRDDAVCIFETSSGSLRIKVQTMETPRSEFSSHAAQCGTDSVALKAIGNEAVVCNPEGKRAAQVVSRVRNKIFTILIATPESQTALREKARNIAEQVAGNLF